MAPGPRTDPYASAATKERLRVPIRNWAGEAPAEGSTDSALLMKAKAGEESGLEISQKGVVGELSEMTPQRSAEN